MSSVAVTSGSAVTVPDIRLTRGHLELQRVPSAKLAVDEEAVTSDGEVRCRRARAFCHQ
jgi:hypothetical protein